jgi:hypothetical protein
LDAPPLDAPADPGTTSQSSAVAASGASAGAAQLVGLGVGGVALLSLSLLVAHKARRPRPRRPRRRSFEAGRLMGRATRVAGVEDALAKLRWSKLGQVTAMGANEGRVRVAIQRRRSEPCEMVAGYLTGLFEEAWASDVAIGHERCAGRKRGGICEYDIIRAVHRAEAASTRGSAGARDRSPRARGGAA